MTRAETSAGPFSNDGGASAVLPAHRQVYIGRRIIFPGGLHFGLHKRKLSKTKCVHFIRRRADVGAGGDSTTFETLGGLLSLLHSTCLLRVML